MESLARSICSTDRALTEKDEQIKGNFCIGEMLPPP